MRDNCFTCRAGDTHPVMADEGPPSTFLLITTRKDVDADPLRHDG
jgi:hypothetical protein